MTISVKICGLTTAEAIEAAYNADYAGFVFHPPSPRYVNPEKAATLAKGMRPQAVAVTVDAKDALLETIVFALAPAYLQLHGNEMPQRVREVKKRFGIPVIKAIGVASCQDVDKAHAYEDVADMLLFDAYVPKGFPGGNGVAFDWGILANHNFGKPWFLSGGLTPDNVEDAVRITGAQNVDVSSSLELFPGIKNPDRVRKFLKKANEIS